MRGRRTERRGLSPVNMALLFQMARYFESLPVKPPITLFLIGVNVAVHMFNFHVFGFDLSNWRANCLYPEKIVNQIFFRNEVLFNRLFLSALIHADDRHLYYNMLSFMYKGTKLETSLGSLTFAVLISFCWLVSNVLFVVSSYIMQRRGIMPEIASYSHCTVGFSGVIFALKYILNQNSPNTHVNVVGVNVPVKYAAWAELVIISIITPNASFLGHLCGIAAGIAYFQVDPLLAATVVRPLKELFR